MSEKPLEYPPYTPVHNWLLDVAMPSLSPWAWKILCVAIRQTLGWAVDMDQPKKRREWDRISYSQFRKKSGIASDETISRALHECIEHGYLVREPVGRQGWTYRLNRDFDTSTAAVEVTSTAAVEVTSTAAVDTKQRKQRTNGGSDPLTAAEQRCLDLLLTLPDMDRAVATGLAKNSEPLAVEAWVARGLALADRLENPAGLVVARLKAGEPAPEENQGNGDSDDRRRYISGAYAEFIQH